MNARDLLILVVLALLSVRLSADTQNDDFAGMQNNFRGIQSIHAEFNVTKKLGPGYLEITPGIDISVPISFAFNYWETLTSFKYEIFNKTKGSEGLIARHAHTKDIDQYFTAARGGLLTISHHPRDKLWLKTFNPLFQSYSFLFPYPPENPGDVAFMPSLTDLGDQAFWKNFTSTHPVALFEGHADISTIRFSEEGGSESPIHSSEYTYEVYFSKSASFMPVGFRKWNRLGVLVEEVFVNKVGQIQNKSDSKPFFYAKSISFYGYNERGILEHVDTATTDSLSINTITPTDDQLFYIDPGTARAILDADKKVWITVPR